jgi:hypothetical protein
MGHVCDRYTELVLDVWLWLPVKVMRHFLQPVTAMFESLADNVEAAIKEQSEQHNL